MIEKTKREMLAAIEAAESKKATDLVILEMDPTAGAFTDHFVLCTGTSSRQNQSISDEVELQVKHQTGTYAHQVEGYREGEWILVDYMDFIVHIFSEERRAFYGLERLWKSARTLTLEELKAMPVSDAKKKPAKKARAAKVASAKPLSVKNAVLKKKPALRTKAKVKTKTKEAPNKYGVPAPPRAIPAKREPNLPLDQSFPKTKTKTTTAKKAGKAK